MDASEITRRLQSLIDELRADDVPPTRAEYERACAEWFDYQARPMGDWNPVVSNQLEERAERLRKELSK